MKFIFKRIKKSNLFKIITGKLVYWYINFTIRTSKFEIIYNDFEFAEYAHQQVILASWHGRLMIMPFINPFKLAACGLVSDHQDGRLIGSVIENTGVTLIFGSTNKRSAAALREILSYLKKGYNFLITPDGPRGPAEQINSSIIQIASMSGLPIIPGIFSAKRVKLFKTWDKFMFPLPFNHICAVFEKPILIPKNLTDTDVDNYKNLLKISLNNITAIADAKFDKQNA